MRKRIKRYNNLPKLVYTTSKDKKMQELAKFNREQDKEKYNIEYILCMFGKEKKITKEEYDKMLEEGLNVKIKRHGV